MEVDPRFTGLPKAFWANVRTISQAVRYTDLATKTIKIPTRAEITRAFTGLGLSTHELWAGESNTELGQTLLDYFDYRARVLNEVVQHQLMDAPEAKSRFDALVKRMGAQKHPFKMNKQKGEKAGPALLTGAVELLIKEGLTGSGYSCNFDPGQLTTFTRDGLPLRTLARRVDGAFTSIVNPVAMWEIKEYYYTTTFGSRVADGVYETLLDGLELEELAENEGIDCLHYLFVDSHFTWWGMGRSYLCRMIDIMHMGAVDEVIFGSEIYDRIPALVPIWIERERVRRLTQS